MLNAYSDIVINTGEDNYLTTSDAYEKAYTVLASQFINEKFALNAGLPHRLKGLGHACEMVEGTGVGMGIDSVAVPYFPEAKELAGMGMIPGGLHRNRDFRKGMVDMADSIPQYLADILFDPQTSGGLLISVPEAKAASLLGKLHKEGVTEAAIIGEVVAENKGRMRVG